MSARQQSGLSSSTTLGGSFRAALPRASSALAPETCPEQAHGCAPRALSRSSSRFLSFAAPKAARFPLKLVHRGCRLSSLRAASARARARPALRFPERRLPTRLFPAKRRLAQLVPPPKRLVPFGQATPSKTLEASNHVVVPMAYRDLVSSCFSRGRVLSQRTLTGSADLRPSGQGSDFP